MWVTKRFFKASAKRAQLGARLEGDHHVRSEESTAPTPRLSSGGRVNSGGVAHLKPIEAIPGPGGRSPHKLERSHLVFAELHCKYGSIVKFRKGSRWSVLLFDPDLIEEASAHEGACPHRPSPPLYDVCVERNGRQKGLSQSQGLEWLRLRRPVQEFLLQPANIHQYIPALSQVADDLVSELGDNLQHSASFDLEDLALRYAIESSAVYCINARLGFLQSSPSYRNSNPDAIAGREDQDQGSHNPTTHPLGFSAEERAQLLHMVRVFMSSIAEGFYRFPIYRWFRTKLYREFEEASESISNLCQQRVRHAAKSMQRNGLSGDSPNLLNFLLSDGRLELNKSAALLGGFFSTATDNISNSLGLVFWHLARNQDKQDRLREEIARCVTSSGQVSPEEMSHMPYLKACVKESFRVAFPFPVGSVRVMPRDIALAGYHIPQGTTVYFGHNALCHSAEHFEAPEEYRPERWLKQTGSSPDPKIRRRQAICVQPFGLGPRNCVGRRLAEQQMFLAVIKVLQRFKVKLGNPQEELDIVHRISARSSRGLDIQFEAV
ncbi:probable cytochrome P450 49a1 [Aplysia californica]|uniref:Probable cytochrome P450 49a1 n=1 Tax=Aplysia californica TaxID=6500 RepID=A0ABM1VQA3_APLCA|nr:probable cytochrome P450 49a1 [Aplysia californica]